jgi:hypothetical protein
MLWEQASGLRIAEDCERAAQIRFAQLARISHSPVDEVGELGLKKVGKGRLFMA